MCSSILQVQKMTESQRSKYGKYKKLCGMQHGEAWLTLGSDRWFCIMVMTAVNLISLYLLFLLHSYKSAYPFFILHVVILIYVDITWIATGIINPGIKTQVKEDPEDECMLCEDPTIEDQSLTTYNHCQECQVCIEDRDHHCHITGGCIGSGNRVAYYFFLLGMFVWVVDLVSTAPYAYYLIF